MDEYSRLSRNASLGVHGYALVFSIASRQSFDMIDQVNTALLNSLGDLPDVPRVLVGTKQDMADDEKHIDEGGSNVNGNGGNQRQVSQVDAQKLADSWGGVPYIECSSKNGVGVSEVFHTLLKEIEKDDGIEINGDFGIGCVIQ